MAWQIISSAFVGCLLALICVLRPSLIGGFIIWSGRLIIKIIRFLIAVIIIGFIIYFLIWSIINIPIFRLIFVICMIPIGIILYKERNNPEIRKGKVKGKVDDVEIIETKIHKSK